MAVSKITETMCRDGSVQARHVKHYTSKPIPTSFMYLTSSYRLCYKITKVYLTSPEPSKNCHNLFIVHPISKTLTLLESSQLSASDDILH